MSKRSKKHAEEHENLERWLITYADMITLLMAFFIMMYAMSIVNKGKFDALAVSVRTGFGGPIAGALPDILQVQQHPLGMPGQIKANDFELATLVVRRLEKNLAKATANNEELADLMKQIKVVPQEHDLILRLSSGPITFHVGSAELTAASRRILAAAADLLAGLDNPIRIEGHTCNLPIHTARFASNWELSGQRALNVLTFLISRGIKPNRLSAVAYADTRPLVPNVDEAHRRLNRRVDLVIVGALKPRERKQIRASAGADEALAGAGEAQPEHPRVAEDLKAQVVPRLDVTRGEGE